MESELIKYFEVLITQYECRIKKDGNWYTGEVRRVGLSQADGAPDVLYFNKNDGGIIESHFDPDCEILFGFLFTWRGVWDSRIYFKMDEYDGDDLKEIAELWDKVQDVLKQKMKEENPKIYD